VRQGTPIPVSILPKEDQTKGESFSAYEINAFISYSDTVLNCRLFIYILTLQDGKYKVQYMCI